VTEPGLADVPGDGVADAPGEGVGLVVPPPINKKARTMAATTIMAMRIMTIRVLRDFCVVGGGGGGGGVTLAIAVNSYFFIFIPVFIGNDLWIKLLTVRKRARTYCFN
jgi:hypothetical protein